MFALLYTVYKEYPLSIKLLKYPVLHLSFTVNRQAHILYTTNFSLLTATTRVTQMTTGMTTPSEVFSTAQTTDFPIITTQPEPCFPRDDCMGHYTCNNETQAIECLEGWTGEFCIDTTFAGEDNPDCPPDVGGGCKNGGTCFDNTCCCIAGFTGDLCEREIIECDSSPCQNEGTCIDELNFFVCNCVEGKDLSVLLIVILGEKG